MKIRTDFVTNSSSSCYSVEISLRDLNDKNYSVFFPVDDDCRLWGNLRCHASEILNAESLDALFTLIKDRADAGDSDKEYEEDEITESEKTQSAIFKFGEDVKEGISDLSQTSTLTITKTYFGSGEGMIDFIRNCADYDEYLQELATTIVSKEGEEKEAAKEKMTGYLAHYPDFEECWFPTNFMGKCPDVRIAWEEVANSIEEFARGLLNHDIFHTCDSGVEIRTFDMQKHEVISEAIYYFSPV